MRLSKPTCLLIGSLFLIVSACQSPKSTALEQLKRAPKVSAYLYTCKDMVQCVNGLRHLGKEQALLTLKQYVQSIGPSGVHPEQEEKLLLICRLLFVNPNGWKFPRLGQPSPDINWDEAEKLPYFPIALSDGVPFLLVNGYMTGGWTSDTGFACVKLCEHFSIRTNDLSDKDFRLAARHLIESDSFKQLYTNSEDRRRMMDSMMFQAEGIYQIRPHKQ
jgi:hypothetical protein